MAITEILSCWIKDFEKKLMVEVFCQLWKGGVSYISSKLGKHQYTQQVEIWVISENKKYSNARCFHKFISIFYQHQS